VLARARRKAAAAHCQIELANFGVHLSAMRGVFFLRAVGLLAVSAVVLHQAAYSIGGSGQGSLGGHGHGYLPLAAALATVLLALGCVSFARSLWRALRGACEEPAVPSFKALWPISAAALLAVFSLQEWIESFLSPGHSSGPAHVAAHVGWTGILLALALGALVALALRGAREATRLIAERRASLRRLRPPSGRGTSLPSPLLPRLDVLAVHGALRAPPALSV
jgi:hypothetical protein